MHAEDRDREPLRIHLPESHPPDETKEMRRARKMLTLFAEKYPCPVDPVHAKVHMAIGIAAVQGMRSADIATAVSIAGSIWERVLLPLLDETNSESEGKA